MSKTCCQSISLQSEMDLDNVLPTCTRTKRKACNYNGTNEATDKKKANRDICHRTQNGKIMMPRAQNTALKRKQKQVLITRSFVNDYAVNAGNKNLDLTVNLSKITLPECSVKFKNNMSCLNKKKKETNEEIEKCSIENNRRNENNVTPTIANDGQKPADKDTSDNMFLTPLRDGSETYHTPLRDGSETYNTPLRDGSERYQNQDDSISLYASSFGEDDNQGLILERGHYKPYHNNGQHRFNGPRTHFSNRHNNNNNTTNNFNNRSFLFKELNDICKFYFFEDNCFHRKCRYSHSLRYATKNHLIKLPLGKLRHIYNLSKEFRNLYFPILELFIVKLVLVKSPDELVCLVDDILNQECLDRSQYIEQIVYGLQNIGFSLNEAVTKIFSSQSNKDTSFCINEILLNIIVKESSNLEENWYLVKKLTQNFQEMDFGVVTDIIQACLNKQPPSYSFCSHICTDILKKFDINVDNISESLLWQFKKMLRKMELTFYDDTSEELSTKAKRSDENGESVNCKYPLEEKNKDVNEQSKSELVCENQVNAVDFAVEENMIMSTDCTKETTDFENNYEMTNENYGNDNNENETTKLNNENTVTSVNVNETPTVICPNINNTNGNESNVVETVKQIAEVNPTSDKTVSSSLIRCIQNENLHSEEFASSSKENNNEENSMINQCSENNTMYTVKQTNNMKCSNNEIDMQVDESINTMMQQVSDRINITPITNLPPNSPVSSTKLNSNNVGNEPMISDIEDDEPTSVSASPALNVELLEGDIMKLHDVIKKESVDGFTVMLHKNKCVHFQKSFILNVIVILKNQNKLCKDYVESLLKFERTLIGNDSEMKTLVQSLALNLIEILGEKGKWNRACNIFKLFSDVEDVINSDCYVNKKSLLQRYFFSCLILIRGNELDRAFDLLKTSKVNMLDVNTWTDYEERDVHRQITVLSEFFDAALENNLLFKAYSLICCVINKQYVLKLDIWNYLNSVIKKMTLDFETYSDELCATTNNILSGVWDIKNFSVATIRSLIMIMSESRFQTFALNLYKKCCQYGIYYHQYDGSERSVIIRVDMTIEEMIMILTDFLMKLVKGKFRVRDVTVHISFPLDVKEMNNSTLTDVSSVKKNIQKVLTCLMTPVPVSFSDNNSTDVVIKASDIEAYIKS